MKPASHVPASADYGTAFPNSRKVYDEVPFVERDVEHVNHSCPGA